MIKKWLQLTTITDCYVREFIEWHSNFHEVDDTFMQFVGVEDLFYSIANVQEEEEKYIILTYISIANLQRGVFWILLTMEDLWNVDASNRTIGDYS